MSTGGGLIRRLSVAVAAALLVSPLLASPASAHGAVSDPPARQYGCYTRWASDWQSPRMATEDPMCYKAWQADPSAMWNWNGLLRDGVGGAYQTAVPDGQLCSGGLTFNGRYAAMDEPGPWKTVDKPNRFTLNLLDGSSHGADFIRVYVTKQGFDPLTQRLKWSDLELVTETGRMPTGTTTPVEVYAPGRTGHHIVFTLWQASHLDQSYYFCSDVNFTGGGNPSPSPSPSPSASPSHSPSPSPSASPSASPSSSPSQSPSSDPGLGCSATYRVVSQWSGGFQAEVRVVAGSRAINGWKVGWTFTGGEKVSSAWNATLTTSGSTIDARSLGYNGALGAGTGTTFGLLGTGTSGTPTLTCTAS
ncbi:lytic polysaccharide monooxygenase [Microbispora triticiradicis]|uniref:lytic polysaccharide monooxygenase n=1 Tax=Microbispora triticiradicis TaxID=2200763 RepID=UPI001AD670D8|nr:lytic polysaccharide monooxygenase [Microbispora triticiradicis]MBO4269797.1 cellulose-binding protein [Microbispora triticiradicis]